MSSPSTADRVLEGCEVIGLFFTSVFPAGQRILQHQSDVLETVVLVNPSEETATSEVSRNLTAQTEHCRVTGCSESCIALTSSGPSAQSKLDFHVNSWPLSIPSGRPFLCISDHYLVD